LEKTTKFFKTRDIFEIFLNYIMDQRDNLSLVIYGKNDLRIEQSKLPGEPGPYGLYKLN
jgi:hypothetical protein